MGHTYRLESKGLDMLKVYGDALLTMQSSNNWPKSGLSIHSYQGDQPPGSKDKEAKNYLA